MAKEELQSPLLKVFGLLVIWSLAHHFIAGIRYFLLDLDIGIEKNQAQKSAVAVMIAGFLVFAGFTVLLF